MKLIILIGLPGSGKSSWAKQYESENPNCRHIEFDKCCILEPIYFSFEDAIMGEISKNSEYGILILDFIFSTNKHIETIINSCNNIKVEQVELHYWETNRQQCIINDRIRMILEKREYDCSGSIKHRKIEQPALEYFKEKYKDVDFYICNHEVYKCEEINQYANHLISM